MSGTVSRVMAVVAFMAASPASAHGGEEILCLPVIWAFDLYKTCIVACVDCGTCCCPGRRARDGEAPTTPPAEQPPVEEATPVGAGPERARGTFLH